MERDEDTAAKPVGSWYKKGSSGGKTGKKLVQRVATLLVDAGQSLRRMRAGEMEPRQASNCRYSHHEPALLPWGRLAVVGWSSINRQAGPGHGRNVAHLGVAQVQVSQRHEP